MPEVQNKSGLGTMFKEAGILLAITLIAGLLLGVVNELTEEPIRIQQEKAIQEACQAVFPDIEGISEFRDIGYAPEESLAAELASTGVEIGTVYAAMSGEVFNGYVVEAVSSEGYGGDIVLYVGVSADGVVNGVSILELSETPGLGMEAPKVLVPQFAGRAVDSFVYTKTGASAENEVDAITSATITTSAVVSAVNGGIRVAVELLKNDGLITDGLTENNLIMGGSISLGGGFNE